MVIQFLFALNLFTAPAASAETKVVLFDRETGKQFLLESSIDLGQLINKIDNGSHPDEYLRIWTGFNFQLRSKHILRWFRDEQFFDRLAFMLSDGSVLAGAFANPDDQEYQWFPAEVITALFASAAFDSNDRSDLHSALFLGGEDLVVVPATPEEIESAFEKIRPSPASLTLEGMKACSQQLALTQHRPPAKPVE